MALNLKELGVTEADVVELVKKEKARKERAEVAKERVRRQWAKYRVLTAKAEAAGIAVSEAEIDAELAK